MDGNRRIQETMESIKVKVWMADSASIYRFNCISCPRYVHNPYAHFHVRLPSPRARMMDTEIHHLELFRLSLACEYVSARPTMQCDALHCTARLHMSLAYT